MKDPVDFILKSSCSRSFETAVVNYICIGVFWCIFAEFFFSEEKEHNQTHLPFGAISVSHDGNGKN